MFGNLGGRDQVRAPNGHIIVLCGLEGMGKTQLSLTYAAEHTDEFSAISYVDSSSESSIRLSFRYVTQRYLDRTVALTKDTERQSALRNFRLTPFMLPNGQLSNDSANLPAITAVKGILEQEENGKWLLGLDNMDDLEKFSVEGSLPQTTAGRVIITSRSTAAVRLGYAIEVDDVAESEGFQYC